MYVGIAVGVYVGRIVGLVVVALGIAAAVFVGQGVASAEPSTKPGSASSSTTSGSSTSGSSSQESRHQQKTNATTDSDETKTIAAEPTPMRKKKSSSSQQATEHSRETHRTTESTASRTVQSNRTELTKPSDNAKHADNANTSEDPGRTSGAVVASAPKTADEPRQQPPAPVAAVTTAISSTVSAVLNPFAGNSPTMPVESPLPWMVMAAARQEFGRTPRPAVPVDSVTTSADIKSAPAVSTLAATDAPTHVVAIPQTPLLQPLQQLPVVGPLFVTPLVALIEQIPLISDILHPIIGYPIGLTGGTTPRDVKVISFDGTPIYVHFFPAQGLAQGTPAPTILNGPGLGLPGETNPTAAVNPFLPNQVIGMAPLLQDGYNVVTWDPRGEWSSGGRLEIDSPEFEARDMQAIVSWLAQQPEVQLDAPNDPRIGMVGASYGGGIQLVTAAVDKRVDAIVPTIAWNNLNTSLDKAGSPKTSWGALLTADLILTGARADPQIYTAVLTTLLTGSLPRSDQDFLDDRSPFGLLQNIAAPTLFIQGTVDTLFSLQEAHKNAIALIGNGVPTKVVWYCGGHGACISTTNDDEMIERATLDWLDRYVKGDPKVNTGPQFEWVDQHGQMFSSDVYPVPTGPPLTASTEAGGVLPLRLLVGGSGPNLAAFAAGPIAGLLGILSGAEAGNAVELTVPAKTTTYIVGAPELEFTYSGTGTSRHVYAQLVDDTTGLVLGNQVTPIPVTLDGQQHTVTTPLEMVAHTLAPGETVTLQLVASAVEYQALSISGVLKVSSMKLSLPTADAAEVSTAPEAATTAAA